MFTELTAADGHEFQCWIEPAQGDRRGGLVVLQEIFGVTDQLKGVAARYAREGYEVAIPALFDRVERGTVLSFDEGERGRALMQQIRSEDAILDAAAAAERLREAGGGIGMIGFCWGGGLAIRAAQLLELDAVVSFYGTRVESHMVGDLKAPVQGHWGTEDSHAKPATLKAVTERFPSMEVHLYDGAGHAFANEERPQVHDPEAAELAHSRAVTFLARHMS